MKTVSIIWAKSHGVFHFDFTTPNGLPLSHAEEKK